MNQLDAELRRFFARRIVRGTVLLTVLIAIVSIGIATFRGHPARAGTAPVPIGKEVVTDQNGHQEVTYSYSSSNPPSDSRIHVGQSLGDTLVAMAIVMLFVSVVLGASFVGADFNVGSLTSQLLYEPRRWRVHLAKAVGVGIGCAAVTAFVCVVIGALLFGGSELHGVVRGIDSTWWQHRGIDLARAIGTAAAAGIMAYAVTLVAHRSSAAIVLFLVQFPFIHIVREDARVFGPISRYAPFRGLLAMSSDIHGSANIDIGIRTNAGALAFTAVWIVILVALSGGVFARAEVR